MCVSHCNILTENYAERVLFPLNFSNRPPGTTLCFSGPDFGLNWHEKDFTYAFGIFHEKKFFEKFR